MRVDTVCGSMPDSPCMVAGLLVTTADEVPKRDLSGGIERAHTNEPQLSRQW